MNTPYMRLTTSTLLFLALTLALWGATGCKKSQPSTSSSTEPDNPRQRPSEGDTLSYTIDGSLDDWKSDAVVKDLGHDKPKSRYIDIKDVYLSVDQRRLYMLIQTDPSIGEWSAQHARTVNIVEVYIDADNNPATGCQNMSFMHDGKEFSGYDIGFKVGTSMVVRRVDGEPRPTFPCKAEVVEYDSEQNSFTSLSRNRMPRADHCSDGPNGVEFSFQLGTLGIAPGSKVRVLILEDAYIWSHTAYAEVSVDTPKP